MNDEAGRKPLFSVSPANSSFIVHHSSFIVLFPVFNELLKEKDREQLIQLYKRSSKVVIALIGFLVITAVDFLVIFLTWSEYKYLRTSKKDGVK